MVSSQSAAGALCILLLCYLCGGLTYLFSSNVPPPLEPNRRGSILNFDMNTESSDKFVNVYLGAGCFWHVQHELIKFEQQNLLRSAESYTSVVGYAGGRDKETQPCYHNSWNINDYNSLGHTEVVQLRVPETMVTALATYFFNELLVNGDRVDTQDKGPEYRSVIGVPGGIYGRYGELVQAARHEEVELVEGRGNDPDTLRQGKVFVMDSDAFPFFQAEIYHQFHDDMVEKYNAAYHELKRMFVRSGRLKPVPPCSDDEL